MTRIRRQSCSPSMHFPATIAAGILAATLAITLFGAPRASAQTLKVLYSFSGGTDGGQPYAKLVADASGNGYGTTNVGGDLNACPGTGCGVIFELGKKGQYHVLYTFEGGADGANPLAGLLRDSAGNIYGTTEAGGTAGYGTVFQFSHNGQKTVLYNFQGGSDGSYPFAGLITDGKGNLFGTTYRGGPYDCGTVFKLSKSGETVLYSFKGGNDGQYPYSGLVRDSAGNLFGTTFGNGLTTYGTVFRVSPTGKETVLHAFTGGADGGYPSYGSLVLDPATGLYGTTSFGGAYTYFGTVFKVDKTEQFSVIYSFTGGADGGQPNASLIRDAAGNFYGVTIGGGAFYAGTIFMLDKNGNESVLYSFTGGTDPGTADAPLLRDAASNLYGTSIAGGAYGQGTVFKLTP
jgi:uncharacterized repeat protein (TIGR03803 family)